MTLQSLTVLVAILLSLWWPSYELARADDSAGQPARRPSPADVSAAARRFDRGLALIEQHDYAGAISELEEAYRLDPQHRYLYNLGVAHHSNGNRDQAIDYYQRYLAAESTGALAAEARWQLVKLEAERAEQVRLEAARTDEQARSGMAVAEAQVTAARAEAAAAHTEAKAARERAIRAEQEMRKLLPCPAGDPSCAGPPSRVDRGIAEDAVAGRGWVTPTALTAPAGTWTLSDIDLLMVSASYAVSDRFAMGVGVMLPTSSALPYASLTAKYQLLRAGRLRLAAHGLLTRSEDFRSKNEDAMDEEDGDGDADGDADGKVTLGVAGGALTLCIDKICRSHLSGYLGVGIARGASTSGTVLAGGSLVLGLGRRFKAVFEVNRGAGGEVGDAALAWYGFRLTARAFAFELGAVMPINEEGERWARNGMPFVGFTYRSYAE